MSEVTESSVFSSEKDELVRTVRITVRSLLRTSDWGNALPDIIQQFAAATEASHCCLFRRDSAHPEEMIFRGVAAWTAPGVNAHLAPDDHERIDLSEAMPQETVQLLASGEIVIESLGDSPATITPFLSSYGVQTIAVAPVLIEDQWWGFICLENHTADRPWAPATVDALRLVADTMGAALERRESDLDRAKGAAIVDNSDDAIISKTLDGTVTRWNAGAERIYGYRAEEVLGKSIRTIIPDSRYDEFVSIMEQLSAGEHIDHHETVRVRKDGREIDVSISISPIRDALGVITGAVTIARDITEHKQAELTIRASEERLRLALEAGDVGAWDWYVESGDVVWSHNMETLHGMTPGTFAGSFEAYLNGIHPEDRQSVIDALQYSLEMGEGYSLEYRSVRNDGREQWLRTNGQVIRNRHGRAVRMTGVCFDVTQRKRAEAQRAALVERLELAHAEADAERTQLQELFQHTPAMMALLEGPDHILTMVNDHQRSTFGGRALVGRPVAEAVPELQEQGVLEMMDYVYRTGESVERSEMPIHLDVRGDGTTELRYISFAYQPVLDADGHVTAILTHSVDMTDHVRARQRIEELAAEAATERDRLEQIINVIPEGILITDSSGKFVLMNTTALTILGEEKLDRRHLDYTSFECYSPEGTRYETEQLPLARSLQSGEAVLGEQLSIRNVTTGELIPVLVNAVPVTDESGKTNGAVAVFQDITPLKEFERQKDEFLQAVSHDLKNPLTTIHGYAQLLPMLSADEPERYRTASSNITSATNRAISLLDEMLDLTRLQMGRPLELKSSEVDLVAVSHRLAENHQAMSAQHQIEVVAGTEPVLGFWDELRIERVLANMLSNAISYSPDGGPITVRVDRDDDAGGTAILEISDHGVGIPEEDRPHLFERFWRGTNVREFFRGTGLGLAGAKAIVDAHGGTIDVDSVEGEGTTFTIRLPLRPSESAPE